MESILSFVFMFHAHTGAGSIRMAWGSAQEAASVHALLQVFPDAAVGEVQASIILQPCPSCMLSCSTCYIDSTQWLWLLLAMCTHEACALTFRVGGPVHGRPGRAA